jgi:SAM-dependent methyltransferase
VDASCRICGHSTVHAATVTGQFVVRTFHLRHCPNCRFSFVADPLNDQASIYTREYYEGRGADPLVDYDGELQYPNETIRLHEWRGVASAVSSLVPLNTNSRWLDFGCGTGGLVRYCRERLGVDAWGFEQGEAKQLAGSAGTPLVADLGASDLKASFDVVTAIEVLEHLPEPLVELRVVRSLLKPGGLFFATTGNAQPFRGRLERWRYVVPEIHVSYFEPTTLGTAFRTVGLIPEHVGFTPGFQDIIRFKLLKNMRRKRISKLDAAIPWRLATRLVDRRFRLTAQPVGWAPSNASVSASASGAPNQSPTARR